MINKIKPLVAILRKLIKSIYDINAELKVIRQS